MRRLLMLALLAACGGGLHSQLDIAHRAWWELRTPHFTLRTDLDRPDAERWLGKLEMEYAALVQTYGLLVERPAPPETALADVLLFANQADLMEIDPRVLGFVDRTRDLRNALLLVGSVDSRMPTTQVLMHELAHVLDSWFIGPLPVWLEEGLATYLQTVSVEDGQIVLGHQGVEQLMVRHDDTSLPPLDMILHATPAQFYGAAVGRYYFEARNLVHLLNNSSEDYHRRFQAYLRQLAAGAGADAAWREAMAGVSMDKLADELRYYHTQPGHRVWKLPYEPLPAVAPAVTRMRAGDVHAQWIQAQLVSPARKTDLAPLVAQLDAAVRDDPGWPDADLWRCVLGLARNDLARAQEQCRAHTVKAPRDERGWIGVLRTRLEDAGAEPDVVQLARVATSAAALNDVAWFFALHDQPQAGLGFARRALAADPGCHECEDTLALLLAKVGRYDEAAAAEERAIARSSEHGTPPSYLERLKKYREAAGKP
jgi:hypothetical protein